jgi:hypothetical protein
MVTVVKALTTPELHLWDTDVTARRWTPARMVEHTIAVAEVLQPRIEAVIADHIESPGVSAMTGRPATWPRRTGGCGGTSLNCGLAPPRR